MDEILVSRIINEGIDSGDTNFEATLRLIDRLCESDTIFTWFKVSNNLIGFTSAVKDSHETLNAISVDAFENSIKNFDAALKIIKVSKVNLGKIRRTLAQEFIKKIDRFTDFELVDLEEYFIEFTA